MRKIPAAKLYYFWPYDVPFVNRDYLLTDIIPWFFVPSHSSHCHSHLDPRCLHLTNVWDRMVPYHHVPFPTAS